MGVMWKVFLLALLSPVFVAGASPPVVAAFGDSLSSGYYLPADAGFAPMLAAALNAHGTPAKVINAAVAGDTSGDALLRVDWMLRDKPVLVIVELGANDMLRGLPPSLLYDNLNAILAKIKESGAQVLLAGMRAPPNMGADYAAEFAAVYPRLAKAHDIPLFPFFLQDVAAQVELNLQDGMHPNAAGVRVIVNNILPQVVRLLAETTR